MGGPTLRCSDRGCGAVGEVGASSNCCTGRHYFCALQKVLMEVGADGASPAQEDNTVVGHAAVSPAEAMMGQAT